MQLKKSIKVIDYAKRLEDAITLIIVSPVLSFTFFMTFVLAWLLATDGMLIRTYNLLSVAVWLLIFPAVYIVYAGFCFIQYLVHIERKQDAM